MPKLRKAAPKKVKPESDTSISFSFRHLHKISYASCRDAKFFIRFIERLGKLSELGWEEIDKSQRHSFGYERIKVSQIKQELKIKITRDIDTLFVFRATGDNYVFLGFRSGSVFEVLFIEASFGDIYNH